jgi:hypothetical protein
MRNMSFAFTLEQMYKKQKTVTRRVRWERLKIGDKLNAVEKCMGLKAGEKMIKICVLEIIDLRREPLNLITADDCIREGFPQLSPSEFIAMFCQYNKCEPTTEVTRIEFKWS